MSSTDGPGAPEQDEETRVVQIYHRTSQDSDSYCPLQVGSRDTAKSVIHNAVATLGLDPSLTYGLLEVRESGREERLLKAEDWPLKSVLLWPLKTQRWHPKDHGYYFILQQQGKSDAKHIGTTKEDSDDLCNLSIVTEKSILDTLRERFYERKIYTYISNILIAINPNQYLPVYYNPKYVKMYENQPLGKLSPHIFAIADASFRAMLSRQANQCIVISGESGSGKTESSRYLIHCLTALSQKTYSSGLERTILGAGPVLEAFGNAKTAENNNSSRFGKFIQLNYLESGVIRGAVIEKFLLEKSRLVSRDKSERNYHAFYYLLMGATKEEQQELRLLKPQDYLYLKQKDLDLEDEEKLGQEYKRLHQAMEMVGFLASTKKHIFSVLSAILYLGNVTHTQSEDTRVLETGPADVLSNLSHLLKIKKELLVVALTKRKTVTAKGTVVFPCTVQEATRMRDSMAKSLYSALFDWIIFHINHAMLNRRDMVESVSCLSISVLDVFGFENLQTNSFEQLCINYTNETLQYYINQNIFKHEQDEYTSEGIVWQNINYIDNSGCIQLISNKSVGLFSLLDEESSLPRATDETLLDKLKQHHQDNKFYVASPKTELTFVIKHFAGTVKYHIKDFRKKNTEHMRPEVVSLLRSSELSFMHHLVASSPQALFRWGVLRATIRILSVFKIMVRQRAELLTSRRVSRKSLRELKQHNSQTGRLSSNSTTLDFSFDHTDEHPLEVFEDIFANYELRKKSRGSRRKQVIPKNLIDLRSLQHVVGLTAHDRTSKSIFHPHRSTKPPTVSSQFQGSLGKLMETVEKAEPFFIFCLRSNADMNELHFDNKVVLKQIKYSDILRIVHIQKSGYKAKYTFKEFVKAFRILFPKRTAATPENITELFERMGLDETTYQLGKTKVFLKEKERLLLQDILNKESMRRIIILQRWFRTSLIRLHFLQKRDATLIIQRSWREFYEKHNRAATVIQTAWRSSLKMSEEEHKGRDEDGSGAQPGRVSATKEQFRKQDCVELSPSRTQQPVPGNSESTQTERSREKRDGRGSPPPLNRPLSLPSDHRVGTGNSSTSVHQHNKDTVGTKEKAEKWIGRHYEGDPTDESSPEIQRRRRMKKDEFRSKGKSMSADELSKISSSGSDSSPSTTEITEEHGCSRFSLPARTTNEDSEQQGSHLTTPERIWFLSKFLKKRAPKSSQISDSLPDKSVTLPRYTPDTYHSSNKNAGRLSHNPTIRISRATRVLQWDSSLDREITDPKELRNLDEFLGNQVNELQTRIKELSPTESVFLSATMQFRETIKDMYSVQKPQIGYKDLMKGFHNKVNILAGAKEKAEVSLVVNLFQSVLDGFIRGEMKRVDSEPPKATKATKKRRNKEKCLDSPLDHLFSTYQVNIMQSCDLCGSYIWGMEKAYMCSACKLICHKKCLNRIITDCSTRCARRDDRIPGSLQFGVPVCVLTNKVNPVPKVVELLLMHVELNGLYTEGIYRKSGSACRARELYQILETDPEAACLDNYPIHTITGLVKRWLRELPDPLMTFALYNDFLLAAELPEKADRIRAVYQKIDELPPSNFHTLERLIFHLVRVAKEEHNNKMSPNSLSIVFAPCILRSPDANDPFLGIKDIPKTTLCVEILISEQFRRYSAKMQDIQQLEYAEAQAVNQLKLSRQNTVAENTSEVDIPYPTDSESEKTLIARINTIKQKKVDLACRLPELEQENSDSENMDSSSSMSTDSLDRLGSLESEGRMTMQLKTQKPDCLYKPADLAEKVRTLMAQTDTEEKALTSGPNTTLPAGKSQVTSKNLNGSFEDMDIPYIDEDED